MTNPTTQKLVEALRAVQEIDENGLYREEIQFEGSGRYAVDIDAVEELSRIVREALATIQEHPQEGAQGVDKHDSTGAMAAAWFGTPGAGKAVEAVFGAAHPSTAAIQPSPVACASPCADGCLYLPECPPGHCTILNLNPQPAGQHSPVAKGAHDVLAERERQKSAEGWTPEHDNEHEDGALAHAAACYAANNPYIKWTSGGEVWPRGWEWKPKGGDRRRLVKAGALILAEIERLDRIATPDASPVAAQQPEAVPMPAKETK